MESGVLTEVGSACRLKPPLASREALALLQAFGLWQAFTLREASGEAFALR